MDKLKQWVALAVAGALLILAGGWFLLISPKRSEAADVALQAEQQVSANSALTTQIAVLKAQAKTLPQQQAKLAAVAAKIPDNPALPALIRSLTKAADEAGVELVSLSPSAPAAVAPATAPVAPVAAAPAAGAPAGAAAAPAAPVAPAASVGTLQTIALSVNVVGGYFQIEQFLDRAENLSRAMKVSSLTLAPGSNPIKPASSNGAQDPGKVLGATIAGSVYLATGRATFTTATEK